MPSEESDEAELPGRGDGFLSKGQSYARNTGLAQCHGGIIILTDDDVRFPQQWLMAMADPIVR